jgi:protoporphyrinogen/coproporphyrinogen III oxidase
MKHVDLAVIGAGITGLATAWEATQRGAEVVVLDASERVGGKLRTSMLAGTPLDEAADGFLARVPEAVALCSELGIETELVSPATGHAYVWSQGELRELPGEQLLGVPTDLKALAASGILSAEGLARAQADLDRSGPDEAGSDPWSLPDESVGSLIRRRLGDEVLDRLVGPLIGGIWAGNPDHLSIQTATPQLAALRGRHASLIRTAAEARAATLGTAGDKPVFLTPRDGMARLVEALHDALGDPIRLGQQVDGITAASGGTSAGRWQIDPAGIAADAVVVTTPSYAAAPLVAPHCPAAAETLAAIEHSSVILVALAMPRDAVDHPLDGSGFLVPPSEGRLMTACSWWSSKWPHLNRDPDVALLRVSAGRDGDARALALDDTELVAALRDELAEMLGAHGEPIEVRVNRWVRSFPQPRPGHMQRVDALEADLDRASPGLTVAGAWARGVGIPACIRAGRRAAGHALDLRSSAS